MCWENLCFKTDLILCSSILCKFHDLDSEMQIQKVNNFFCFRRFVKYRSQPDQRLSERLHQVQLLERRRRRKGRSRGQQTWHVDAGIYRLLLCIITLKFLISGLIKSLCALTVVRQISLFFYQLTKNGSQALTLCFQNLNCSTIWISICYLSVWFMGS